MAKKIRKISKPAKYKFSPGFFYLILSLIVLILIVLFVNTSKISTEPKASEPRKSIKNTVKKDIAGACASKYGGSAAEYYSYDSYSTPKGLIYLGSAYDIGWFGFRKTVYCYVLVSKYISYNDSSVCTNNTFYDSSGKYIGSNIKLKCKLNCSNKNSLDSDLDQKYVNNTYVKGTYNLIPSVCSTVVLNNDGSYSKKTGTCCYNK